MARFVAAALLLLWPPSVSKILCISPTGHEAIEDEIAPCCAPALDAISGQAISPESPCRGCTDYPISAAAEIKATQPHTERVVNGESWAVMLLATAGPAESGYIRSAIHPNRQSDSISSPIHTTTLRC